MIQQRLALGAARASAVRQQLVRPATRRWAGTAQENAFNAEREGVKHHAAESAETWRKMSLYVAIPCLFLASANAYRLWTAHWEHEAHEPPPSEKPQYDYLNIRSKAYPWGDGDKTLFWNDNINYKKED